MSAGDNKGTEGFDWGKMGGLIPAVVQDARTGAVLMLGYMNPDAYEKTLSTGLVTFFSRSRNALWTKGETSGNHLRLVKMAGDCDMDAILVLAEPSGYTCHLGFTSCFDAPARESGEAAKDAPFMFLRKLESVIAQRANDKPEASYTAKLLASGMPRVAQKVAEEGAEAALAAVAEPEKLANEAADLLFHLLVLLKAGGKNLDEVIAVLQARHK
ncbi:MAG: bifunctional phosphoribosyl-AMP cyclohydrolase/phosphoribosyl-ATP diphosphatase HisIE [Alphaproteobacteria bacterium]|nr:bifunctional phosphoribosyl-AMP cyclohydrolase/phosphoribosyl-ATP diphosphatase HisIE [Alphaproteobacteria bacterium]